MANRMWMPLPSLLMACGRLMDVITDFRILLLMLGLPPPLAHDGTASAGELASKGCVPSAVCMMATRMKIN